MEEVLRTIKNAHESGKKVKVCIMFGTVEGCFFIQNIKESENPEDWVFQGESFKLSTGRYKYNRTEENTEVTRYLFSPKLERHPRKNICFEVSL